jgi:transcriptional regulator with XRE-family HTH domain
MTIGNRIRTARKMAKMTQAELAKASGLSQQMISALESGRRQNTFELVHVAKALGVRYEWLAVGLVPIVDNGPMTGATPKAIRDAFRSLPAIEQAKLLGELLRATAEQFPPESEDR